MGGDLGHNFAREDVPFVTQVLETLHLWCWSATVMVLECNGYGVREEHLC
jgi:hypothetical protein